MTYNRILSFSIIALLFAKRIFRTRHNYKIKRRPFLCAVFIYFSFRIIKQELPSFLKPCVGKNDTSILHSLLQL